MRKLFVLQCILCCLFASAQVTSLPSASSFSQTRYDGASVNESSGRIMQNIPLLNYNVGKLNIPVSLNYVGNGVKVVQQSNWVGTNWNLNAGGVVTRIVNDYPDEKATERIFFDQIESQGTQQEGIEYLPVPNDTRDFKVDIFSFSFPGYSGSFYLDENMTPRLMDNSSELKIEFVGGISAISENTILITTPNGEKYYFGGANAFEKSSTLLATPIQTSLYNNTQQTQQINQTVAPLATTAFYLFKIENYYGDEILIEYDDFGSKNFVLFEKQKLPITHGSETMHETCFDIENIRQLKRTVFHGTIHNVKKIKRIYSNSSDLQVVFNSSALVLPADGIINTPQYDDRILNSITLEDTFLNETLKKFNLDYLMPNGANSFRFFLEKISIFNSSTAGAPACESYRFEYNTPNLLPSRFSPKVDLLGYYNGQNNTILIAQNEDLEFDTAFQNLAIREPNFQYASMGALTRVHTPTGGVTEFEYESPILNVVKPVGKALHIYRRKPAYNPIDKLSDSFNIGGELPAEEGDPVLYSPKEQTLKVDMNAVIAQSTGAFYQHRVLVEVKDIASGIIQSDELRFSDSHELTYTKIFNFTLSKDHAYTVKIKLDPESASPTYASLEVYATFGYEFYENFQAMGLRIKSIKNFTDSITTTPEGIKRYFYKKAKDITSVNDDSAVVTFDPKLNKQKEVWCCTVDNVDYHFDSVSLIADPFAYYFAPADNQTEYKYVTISYGGNVFEQGGTEKQFIVEKKKEIEQYLYRDFLLPDPNMDFGGNFDNTDNFNGTLLREKLIAYTTSGPIYKGETEYLYNQTIDHEIKNVAVIGNPSGCITQPDEFSQETPAIAHYSNYSFRNNLVSVINREFLEPLPINSEASVRKITSTTEMEYGNLRGLPKKIKKSSSKGEVYITEYKYPVPVDFGFLALNSDNYDAYMALYTQNNIGSPIETKLKKRGIDNVEKLLSTSRSLFLVGANNQVLPQKVETAKAEFPLKSNVEFTAFDSKNNLVEVTQENQLKKSTIYGYKGQMIIAELSNVAYNDISTTTINNLKYLSDNITDAASETALFNALNQLRSAHLDAQITTNVYNKYLQLKSSTDARGYTIYYEYDDCKRLRLTKDQDGNILEEQKYNLKNN